MQPGQIVGVSAELGHEEIARAIAASAYERGREVRRRLVHRPARQARAYRVRAGRHARVRAALVRGTDIELGEQRGANITIRGTPSPAHSVGSTRSGPGATAASHQGDEHDRQRAHGQLDDRRLSDRALGAALLPELDDDAALARLWQEVKHVSRLDEPDPLAAWEDRIVALERAAEAMNDGGFDAIHFEGEGTDLTIGLLPTSTWRMARWSTVDGIRHLPNVPSEEVFTSPDPARVEGHVRSTKPLVLSDGTLVRGLRGPVRRRPRGRDHADEGAEVLRGRTQIDEGASRLGEVALVDRESRIGQLGTVFYETLLDENAASHIALGSGFSWAVETDEDRARVNQSAAHIDFMIGSNDVDVTGVTKDGERVPVLRDGAWQLTPVHAA